MTNRAGVSKIENTKKKVGRPRKDRCLAEFRAAGEPPTGLLQLATWYNRLVAIGMAQARDGRGSEEVREEIRAAAIVVFQLVPAAAAAQVQGLVDYASIDPASEPPADPLAGYAWASRVIALDTWELITSGESTGKRGKELRASGRTLVKCIPPDELIEARKRQKAASQAVKAERALRAPEPLSPDTRHLRAIGGEAR